VPAETAWEAPEPTVATEPRLSGILPRSIETLGLGRWNVETVRPRGQILSAAWSPDGTRLASDASDSRVIVRDPEGNVQQSLDGGYAISSVAWSRDGQHLVAGGMHGSVWTWSLGGREKGTSLILESWVTYNQ
jgi:WD40 repeat protein